MSNNKEIRDLLIEIDTLLGRVSVHGDDIFAMADSRRLLKMVYNKVSSEQGSLPDGKEVTVDGG